MNRIMKRFGLPLLVLLGLGIWSFGDRSSSADSFIAAQDGKSKEGENPSPAPEFKEIKEWVNSKPLTIADQKGKVVLVHFWTHGCINCIHNYPHYRAWQEKFKDNKDLLMIGVHTAEFESEKEVKRIKDQAEKNKLAFPIAVDNDGATWRAWNNHYWPSVYVVDGAGKIRTRWEGELGDEGYKKVTAVIEALLKDLPEKKK